MKKQSSREAMPIISSWINSLREAFGKECIDEQLMRAKKGEPVFYAKENEHQFGVAQTSAKSIVQWDAYFRSFSCDISDGKIIEIPKGIKIEMAQANTGMNDD